MKTFSILCADCGVCNAADGESICDLCNERMKARMNMDYGENLHIKKISKTKLQDSKLTAAISSWVS